MGRAAATEANAAGTSRSDNLIRREATLVELRTIADHGHLFAVIDACDLPAVPCKVDELGHARAASLYLGTAEEMYSAIAPYVFAVDRTVLDWIVTELWGKPWGFFSVAESNLEAIRRHFRRFLLVQAPSGEHLYFRFYDPRVLEDVLDLPASSECRQLMASLDALGIPLVEPGTVLLVPRPTRTIRLQIPGSVKREPIDRAGRANQGPLLQIGASFYSHLSQRTWDRYITRLIDRMRNADFIPYLEPRLASGEHLALRHAIEQAVGEAEELGFSSEEDVTALVLFRSCAPGTLFDPAYNAWIETVVRERSIPVEDRLDAMYELLPAQARLIIFGPPQAS